MASTPTPADDHRPRRLLARVPAAARVTTVVVLTGVAATACGSLSAVSLQPVSVDPPVTAAANGAPDAVASGLVTATARGPAGRSASPSPTRSKRSAAATKTPDPSASATGDPDPSASPAPTPAPAPPPTGSAADCQQTFVPSYFYSGTLWDQAIGTTPTPATMFLNVDNGPGTGPDSHFQQLVQSAQQHGITVLGYVDTDYTGFSLSQVESEIADYKAWYGVNGIMLDRTQGTQNALSYYQTLYNYIHESEEIGQDAVVWLNVGAFPVQSFMSVANVIMAFEGDFSSFESESVPGWVSQYGRDRFANVLYSTPEADLDTVVSTSWSRNVGNLFVTDQGDPNPYGQLPSYWPAEATTVGAQC
ncbi:spherulation-specific family 4 protein [Trebonia sp.]|uniref:spherulation-specific family 4 protein n=1 Tax=Trebonia sp. TaxID=2767075 RepID=UPI00261A046B|nr:spherulation-specific family 4 protein [Trebonia sp.]